ncbi:hypothetical protein UVI_02062820 [Ustilaginoidea virens]|uniref:DUF167 domain protein n=1 Tax=Ustilaginoidea virens TaxID=1159556 RepID=A0A1B5L896_USTVR|nr:hypothetical protein UVI_02062820 [Ustilaginoidea virens]
MASSPVVSFIPGKRSSPGAAGSILLRLTVKPRTGRPRQGVVAVTEKAAVVCVAAQPRQGEANEAVIQVLSAAVGIPKPRFQIVRGLRSKDKIVAVGGVSGDGQAHARAILSLLHRASRASRESGEVL